VCVCVCAHEGVRKKERRRGGERERGSKYMLGE